MKKINYSIQKSVVLASLTFVAVFGSTNFSHAAETKAASAKDGESSRDYLINKLQRVLMNLAPSDSAKNGIVLRLADLYSERARQNTMAMAEGSCKGCVSPDADRKKALQLYDESYAKAPETNKAKILVQMGHLNQLLGNQAAAINLYTRITNESSDQVARAEAYLAIAEIYFKKSEWHSAQTNYEKSISTSNNESKGFATYKLGWTFYNQGQIKPAKEKLLSILRTPALLSKSGSNQDVTDLAFHEQVAKDYAIMSGALFEESDLKNIFELSPEKKKLENLFAVSSELERTAKKKEAVVAWNFLYQNQPQPQDRAVTKAHLANVNLQLGNNADALKDMNEAFALISASKEKFPNEAEDTRRLIKASIITWNQAEKKKPSPELLEAYQGYLSNFSYEKEMSQWAVQIASEQKQWATAYKIHQSATANMEAATNDPKNKAAVQDLENHLLLGIELGEASKDPALMLTAQDEYLAKSKTKTKYWEVFYQKAYNQYEKGDGTAFLAPLETIVTSKAAPSDLRIKSGDLYLDYLASKKMDSEIELKAKQFHKIMVGTKGYQSDWGKIAEKSVLNQTAEFVKANQLDQAWAKINNFDIKNADQKDVVTYYKDKIVIAEKRADITSALATAKELSNFAAASTEDKTFAQTKMAYYSDLKMDFKAAMALTEKLPESVLPSDKKNLKLALYSDLLGQNSAAYLKKYIETSKDQPSKEAAVIEIVKKTPAAELDTEIKKQEKSISGSHAVLGQLALMSYAKNGDKSYGLQMVNKNAEIKKTAQGTAIVNDQKLKVVGTAGEQLAKMNLDADITKKDFQQKLVRDIKARSNALTKLEEMTADAIKSKDWTLQVVSLSLVARETDRFYNEIMSLPMPEKLSAEEQGEYMRLLEEQAAPYKVKAEQAKAKSNEFWASAAGWDKALATKLSGDYAIIAQNEKEQLMKVADDKNKALLAAVVPGATVVADTGATKNVPATDIEAAKSNVKNEPFNVAKIEILKDLESKNGNRAMVQYLEGRITDINNDRKDIK